MKDELGFRRGRIGDIHIQVGEDRMLLVKAVRKADRADEPAGLFAGPERADGDAMRRRLSIDGNVRGNGCVGRFRRGQCDGVLQLFQVFGGKRMPARQCVDVRYLVFIGRNGGIIADGNRAFRSRVRRQADTAYCWHKEARPHETDGQICAARPRGSSPPSAGY